MSEIEMGEEGEVEFGAVEELNDDVLLAGKIRIIKIEDEKREEVVASLDTQLGKRKLDSSSKKSFKEFQERKRDAKSKAKKNLPVLSKS